MHVARVTGGGCPRSLGAFELFAFSFTKFPDITSFDGILTTGQRILESYLQFVKFCQCLTTMVARVLTSTSLTGLKKIAEGKVRDLYEIDSETLLFVASDRISAYDVIMENVLRSLPNLHASQ